MTRRVVRTAIQLGVLCMITVLLLIFVDNRYRVLPSSIHNHLPAHHPGLVIVDVTVKTCNSINPISSCRLDPDKWHRIEKDLYLNKSWLSRAYVHVQRKKEEELDDDDRVVLDMKIGRLDPANGEKGEGNERWEARPAGIWLKRSTKPHMGDSQKAVTAVDVLFGADAVEPRPGWEIKDHPLLLDTSAEIQESRISIRRGNPSDVPKPIPRINKDGKFKIMQAADLHLATGIGLCRDPEPAGWNGGKCDADTRTLDFIGKVLDDEKPDLVVLSGDQVNGDTAPDAQSAVFKFAELFIKRKIPYAAIFGNHDDEGSLNRAALMSLIESLPYSLSEPGPATVDGVGNYYVEILARGTSQHSALTLYLLDTHGYSPDEKNFRGYDWLKKNQIDWFKETAQGLKHAHKQYTHVHMDLAFIHIPLPEYRNTNNYIVGSFKEPPTAPGFNSGFKDALVEEGVLLVSCGHDHVNDYCSLDKSPEGAPQLWMCYGGGAGFGGYGGYDGYHRRVRFFEIDMNEARVTTYKRLEYGDTEKRLDEQIIVDAGKVVGGP
ncbi:Metallo-dependent phosphatase [Xylona heveae TC161]|uniref:Metallo-dependent phosphatase n=1 Tax=Xylona heveae (strain CBS 132557 / TC161) TaxID=1328760 RepID=A0A165IKC9_XYLHT|nr:Metallo-dependent phosphatase [Xylona heveae TC161]KZF25019.1 Metallo-dependent phosphatase [Xylona heveae TC161]